MEQERVVAVAVAAIAITDYRQIELVQTSECEYDEEEAAEDE